MQLIIKNGGSHRKIWDWSLKIENFDSILIKILNKTKGNVRVLIYRALNALKELLSHDEKIGFLK